LTQLAAEHHRKEEWNTDQRSHDTNRNDDAGHNIFGCNRGQGENDTTHQRTARQIEAMIFSEQSSRNMRCYQTNKANCANKGNCQSRQKADTYQGTQPHTTDINAKTGSPVLSQTN